MQQIGETEVERVITFKFLGTHTSMDFTWPGLVSLSESKGVDVDLPALFSGDGSQRFLSWMRQSVTLVFSKDI